MESASVVPSLSQESVIDAGVVIAELHQTEKIETVIVAGDFIELGASYDSVDQTAVAAGHEEMQVFGVISAEQDSGAAGDRAEVCGVLVCQMHCLYRMDVAVVTVLKSRK